MWWYSKSSLSMQRLPVCACLPIVQQACMDTQPTCNVMLALITNDHTSNILQIGPSNVHSRTNHVSAI